MFVEIALLQLAIVLAGILFCVVISRQVRKIVVRLTQFKLRTLLIATAVFGVLLAVFKAHPRLIESIVDYRYYYGIDTLVYCVMLSVFLPGAPLLGFVLFDNFRYERDLQRERRERLKQDPVLPYSGARRLPEEPVRPQWID